MAKKNQILISQRQKAKEQSKDSEEILYVLDNKGSYSIVQGDDTPEFYSNIRGKGKVVKKYYKGKNQNVDMRIRLDVKIKGLS